MTDPIFARPTPVISASGWFIEPVSHNDSLYGKADASVRGPLNDPDCQLGADIAHFSQVFHYRLTPDDHAVMVVGINTLTDLLKAYSGVTEGDVHFSKDFQEGYANRLLAMGHQTDPVTSQLVISPAVNTKPVLRPVQVTDGLGNQSVQHHTVDGRVQMVTEMTVGDKYFGLGDSLAPTTIADDSFSVMPAANTPLDLLEEAARRNLPPPPVKLPDGADPRQTMSKADSLRMDMEQKDYLVLFTKRAPTAPWESSLILFQPEVPAWDEKDPSRGRYIRVPVETSKERTTYVFHKHAGRPEFVPVLTGQPEWTHMPWAQAQLLLDWNAIEPILGANGAPYDRIVAEEESTWGESRAANDETSHIDGVNIQVVGNIPEDSVSLVPLASRVAYREGERPFSIQSQDGSPFFVAKPDLEEAEWWEVYLSHDAALSKILPLQLLMSDDHTVTEYFIVYESREGNTMYGTRYLESEASAAEEAAPITTNLANRQYVFIRPWGRRGLRLLREGVVVRFPTKPKLTVFPIL
jgi:hypothetical protein